MRLEQLYFFIEVSKTKSISAAAENLFISQPTLSSAISQLESELQLNLFSRSRNGVRLTTAGEKLLSLAEDTVNNIGLMYELSKQCSDNLRINIYALSVIVNGIIPEILSLYKKSFPNTMIFVHEEKTYNILNVFQAEIKQKDRIFGIINSNEKLNDLFVQTLSPHKIQIDFLCDDHQVCIANSSCEILGSKSVVTMNELENIPKIQYKTHYDIPTNIQNSKLYILREAENSALRDIYDDTNSITVNSLEALKKFIINDLGVAILPSIIAYKDMNFSEDSLKLIPLADEEILMHYYLIYNIDEPLKDYEIVFISCIKELFFKLNN